MRGLWPEKSDLWAAGGATEAMVWALRKSFRWISESDGAMAKDVRELWSETPILWAP
jgi:hypothetical protein